MRSNHPSNLYAYLALGAGIMIIASSAIFVRWADAPGTVTAFYRMAIGTLVAMLPFLRQAKIQQQGLFWRRGLLWAIFGGMLFGLDLAFWTTGIMMGSATMPTLLANTAPLWVGLGAMLIFGERLGGLFWLGLALAMVGAAVVLGQELSQALELGLGAWLGLLAAIFYGGYHLATQRGRDYINTLTYFWISSASAALTLGGINLALGQPLMGYSQNTYLIFLVLGVMIQVFGWLVINYVQGYLPASIVSPTLLLQPLVTGMFAWLLLGERFTTWHFTGGAGILAGIYIIHWSRSVGRAISD